MSQFPPIKPSARNFAPGLVPISSFASVSGKETRVIMGDTAANHTLRLSFENLQEAAVQLITTHWYGQQGTALDFTLPPDVWAGWAAFSTAVTADQKWRYAKQPEVSAVRLGIMSVNVELVALA